MTSITLNSVVRASMGSVPGPLMVNEDATAIVDTNGCPILGISPYVPDWQRRPTLEAICLLFNNRAETIFTLERYPLLLDEFKRFSQVPVILEAA